MQQVKELLQLWFMMMDMGELHYCLGITIAYPVGESLELHQKQYIEKMLKKYQLKGVKNVSITADPNATL